MSNRFGPDRTELKLRLAISIVGLLILAGAYKFNAIGGLGSLEVLLIGTAFFGGSAIWCLRQLTRGE